MQEKNAPLTRLVIASGGDKKRVGRACPVHGCPTQLAIYHKERYYCNSWKGRIEGSIGLPLLSCPQNEDSWRRQICRSLAVLLGTKIKH